MNSEKLVYRKAKASDYQFLLWLRKETMNEHLLKAGFKMTEENHLEGLNFKYETAQIILLEQKQVGLLKLSQISESLLEIIQLQIHPEYQGRGIGKKVIKKVIADAEESKATIILNVLKSNPAKRLYTRMGFKIISFNKHSYKMKWSHYDRTPLVG